MGLASTLVGAAIKTGVSVATDLITEPKMPHKEEDQHEDHHHDDITHGNHTRRAFAIVNRDEHATGHDLHRATVSSSSSFLINRKSPGSKAWLLVMDCIILLIMIVMLVYAGYRYYYMRKQKINDIENPNLEGIHNHLCQFQPTQPQNYQVGEREGEKEQTVTYTSTMPNEYTQA